jgi:hypothetical protein
LAKVKKRIGLSLGADLCWPFCYEEIIKRLDLELPIGKNKVTFEIERVSIEPHRLRDPSRYDLVMDRLTYWYRTSREWIKKIAIMDDTYVLNSPWTFQSMEKQTSYCAMMRLGMPIPETWLVPPKDHEENPDLQRTLDRYARLFDLGDIGEKIGYPLFMKPYDGGAWVGVTKIDNADQLRDAYDKSGQHIMHLQKAVDPYDVFVRCLGIGPQVRIMRYDPSAPLHDRYVVGENELSAETLTSLRASTLTINSFFGWDFNSCELLRHTITDVWHPIDFANACPDSQVTSLHYHFPWLVMAKVRWSLFCTATNREMKLNQDWRPYFEIADRDISFEEKLVEYGKLGEEHFETAKFEEFCATHLGHLEEIVWDFFGSDEARNIIRDKVASMYPEHEWDEFTEMFWSRVQLWRTNQTEAAK